MKPIKGFNAQSKGILVEANLDTYDAEQNTFAIVRSTKHLWDDEKKIIYWNGKQDMRDFFLDNILMFADEYKPSVHFLYEE